ncbi:MAG: nucleotidyl transferase AbiEii/AbiGii toxin family protein [Bacteroidia bacterium]|nr:nucleotidyl transferase AbiEii/AbiGii toxin family protein [Bacteroidia bacterium]
MLPRDYDRSDLDEKFSRVLADDVFNRVTLDEKRSLDNGIPKAHYRFIYSFVLSEKEQEILLDIIFEDPHYPGLSRKPVEAPWVLQKGPAVEVVVPDIESIIGDKLTAFAPNTTGVPYRKNKEREINPKPWQILGRKEKRPTSFTAVSR